MMRQKLQERISAACVSSVHEALTKSSSHGFNLAFSNIVCLGIEYKVVQGNSAESLRTIGNDLSIRDTVRNYFLQLSFSFLPALPFSYPGSM
eukprot:2749980-Karenia_brevis.AAC.1